jgi:hypothetical protein
MKVLIFLIVVAILGVCSNEIKDNYGNSYNIVMSPYTGKIWLDRNLGAKRVCKSIDDKLCYGNYFQWGRKSDGHELKTSEITHIKATSVRVNHGKFISPKKLDVNMGEGWLQDNKSKLWHSLWKGENSLNNPCPTFFRVPTGEELLNEISNKEDGALIDAYKSFLKIPQASLRFSSGEMDTWKWANLWSSDNLSYPEQLMILEDVVRIKNYRAVAGMPIRCIKK